MSKTAQEWAKEILDMADGDYERAGMAMMDGEFLSKINFPDDEDFGSFVYELLVGA